MENLVQIHQTLVENPRESIRRELLDEIDWSQRLICIKGFRGVGKTTFLLDLVKEKYADDRSCLYVNLNNFYFTKRKIVNFADEFYKKGGKVLILDQIHKYPDWADELRICYDSFPELQVIFSASPVLRVIEGHENLQGIAQVYHLEGLSFREYLNFKGSFQFRKYQLDELIANHVAIAAEITEKVKPLAYFNEYLQTGYYPYFLNSKSFYSETLLKHVNLALEIDVTYLNQIELKYLPKLRKLLQIICSQVPFSPNVSKISTDVETSRATIMNYLRYLKNARLINLLFSNGGEDQQKKPDLVYAHNTNILYAVDPENINNRNLRTTFFYNQVGYKYEVKSSALADFKVAGNYHFSIGGKYTEPFNESSFAAADMIEEGKGHIIPLWLFGFLY
ncbi:ATP-binding protein [Gaoshiqia sediminis]|uniref:AAA family ATPase n=1 Tax=Gaoshiqia sediminis TaxID=2986998 RepID=A0AA41Y529_9BACT|nr:AAA family ATPase [Gaoshiqia sediminis]MCW0483584.1 AAA family ATPase [Gaoshiqia sediminis]